MNKSLLHTICSCAILFIAGASALIAVSSFTNRDKKGRLKISFINTANGKKIVVNDSLYSNAFGEQYSISKLKYYISNFSLAGSNPLAENDDCHLINAADIDNSFYLQVNEGSYKQFQFLLGVDSIHNCSGAQTGALDPLNDMFWTWNSGYVMFKLEGNSASSTGDLKRIEHHIGGYKARNNVATEINLTLPEGQIIHIKENGTTELIIKTNLDRYWKNNTEIKISETPICTTTGLLAKKISANFTGLFSVQDIKEYP